MHELRCPHCNSTDVKRYVYGKLAWMSPEEQTEFDKKFISGGCIISEYNPRYFCMSCKKPFGGKDKILEKPETSNDKKRILIAYYSRTGTTQKVAEALLIEINAATEVIRTEDPRGGALGYLKCGREASLKKRAPIKPLDQDPAFYELVIIGTPVWAWNISSPIRSFLEDQGSKIKKCAFFATMGGSGDKNAFLEMERIIGKKPVATLSFTTKNVQQGELSKKIHEFSHIIERAVPE